MNEWRGEDTKREKVQKRLVGGSRGGVAVKMHLR